MSSKEAKIFISYSRADSDFALKLGKDLRSAGANIWIDQLDVSVSERWDQVTEAALESCASFLVILSPDSVESDNVLDEISYALEQKKRIFPVLYRNCKIPFRIRRIQRSDFTQKYDVGFKQLVSALKIQPLVERIEQPKPKEETRKQPAEIEVKTELRKETTKAKIDPKPKRPSIYVKPLIGAMSIGLTVLGWYFIVKPMFDVKPPAETTFASKDVIPPTDSLTVLNQKERGTTKDQPKPKKTVNTSSSDGENKETISDIKQATRRPAAKYQFRSQPKTLSAADVQRMLKTYDFYETDQVTPDWSNPKGKGIANDFQSQGQVVYDAATGLTWQQSGSSGYMNLGDASKYIEQLNKRKFAGYSDWRLPTLEEAMSLMEPTENTDRRYINPIFDDKQYRIWTSDKYSTTRSRAWYVYVSFYRGYCFYVDFDYGAYPVRAVR